MNYTTTPTSTPPDSLFSDHLHSVEKRVAEQIPAELLIDIFTRIRPVFELSSRNKIEANKSAYQVGLAHFAALRLVNRFWNQTITPVIHSEAIIFTLPIETLQKSLKFLDHGAQHIKSLILVDPLPHYTRVGPEILKEARELLAQGLCKCSSSNIQNLECYGRCHTFIKREWVQKTLPNLTLTTNDLVFGRVPTSTLSHALVNLGRSIQRLEIHSWYPPPESRNGAFHLPAKMPLLRDIVLANGHPPRTDIQKLFSRVVNAKKSTPIGHDSPLQFLALRNVETLCINTMLTILRTNSIGKTLVSLFIEPPSHHYWPTSYPIAIVKECPLLLKFSYMFPIKKDLFIYLPPTLRHLHLAIIYDKYRMVIGREEDVIAGVAGFAEAVKPSHYSLEKLQVSTCHQYRQATRVRGSGLPLQQSLLQGACDGAGVALVWSERIVLNIM